MSINISAVFIPDLVGNGFMRIHETVGNDLWGFVRLLESMNKRIHETLGKDL